MKIAYFSPLPPKKTGIATYSAHVIAALRGKAELELFEGARHAPTFEGLPVHDVVAHPDVLATLGRFDACVYHLGNNPHYHLDIYSALLRTPGVVVIHDTVLYYLVAGQGRGGLLKELCLQHGTAGLAMLGEIIADSVDGDILRYRHPERHPLIARTLRQATGVIVHSRWAENLVRDAGYRGPVSVVPHLAYLEGPAKVRPSRLEELRRHHAIRPDAVVIGSLGFLGPTKRIDSVLAALARLRTELEFRFLIVGEGMQLWPLVESYGLERHVIETGFVEDDDFEHYVALCDVVTNLRYPSMGEVSGTLTQALTHGKPTVVTDHGWFSELPDDAVRKIGYGLTEVDELVVALRELGRNGKARSTLGEAGRAFIDRECSPDRVADLYLAALSSAAHRPGSEHP